MIFSRISRSSNHRFQRDSNARETRGARQHCKRVTAASNQRSRDSTPWKKSAIFPRYIPQTPNFRFPPGDAIQKRDATRKQNDPRTGFRKTCRFNFNYSLLLNIETNFKHEIHAIAIYTANGVTRRVVARGKVHRPDNRYRSLALPAAASRREARGEDDCAIRRVRRTKRAGARDKNVNWSICRPVPTYRGETPPRPPLPLPSPGPAVRSFSRTPLRRRFERWKRWSRVPRFVGCYAVR